MVGLILAMVPLELVQAMGDDLEAFLDVAAPAIFMMGAVFAGVGGLFVAALRLWPRSER